jgi:hypothetical protein
MMPTPAGAHAAEREQRTGDLVDDDALRIGFTAVARIAMSRPGAGGYREHDGGRMKRDGGIAQQQVERHGAERAHGAGRAWREAAAEPGREESR